MQGLEKRIERLEAVSPSSLPRLTIFLRPVKVGEDSELHGFQVGDRWIARKAGETEEELRTRVAEIAHAEVKNDYPWRPVLLREERVPRSEEKQHAKP